MVDQPAAPVEAPLRAPEPQDEFAQHSMAAVRNVHRVWPLPAGRDLTWKPISNGRPWPTAYGDRQFWACWD